MANTANSYFWLLKQLGEGTYWENWNLQEQNINY